MLYLSLDANAYDAQYPIGNKARKIILSPSISAEWTSKRHVPDIVHAANPLPTIDCTDCDYNVDQNPKYPATD